MDKQFKEDNYETLLNEQLDQEAEQIEKELAKHPDITGLSLDDSVGERLWERIDEYERQKAISRLSPEDQEALRIGRELRERKEKKAGRRRLQAWKRALGAAAVVGIVATVGITGMGGPEKVLEVIMAAVGDREITTVNSDDKDILETKGMSEEEAFQKIKEVFNIDPVRIVNLPSDMRFSEMDLDEEIRTAHLFYDNEGKIITYTINFFYGGGSTGAALEDVQTDEYIYKAEKTDVAVRGYETKEGKEKKYTAEFKYQEIHYQIVGVMTKKEMEFLLKNLYFM